MCEFSISKKIVFWKNEIKLSVATAAVFTAFLWINLALEEQLFIMKQKQ